MGVQMCVLLSRPAVIVSVGCGSLFCRGSRLVLLLIVSTSPDVPCCKMTNIYGSGMPNDCGKCIAAHLLLLPQRRNLLAVRCMLLVSGRVSL